MYYLWEGVHKNIPFREVVPFSEGPLSEVPLYISKGVARLGEVHSYPCMDRD